MPRIKSGLALHRKRRRLQSTIKEAIPVAITPRPASVPFNWTHNLEHAIHNATEMKRSAVIACWQNSGSAGENLMSGVDGEITAIVEALRPALGDLDRGFVRRTIRNFVEIVDGGGIYYGQKGTGSGGHNRNLHLDSFASQYVLGLIESGYSFDRATVALHAYLVSNGQPCVGRSSVVTLVHSIGHVKRTVKARKQGDTDVDSAWAVRRLNWTTQLAVCLGIMQYNPLLPYTDSINPIPPCPRVLPDYFDVNHPNFKKFSIHQICSWDEMHIECWRIRERGK